MVKMENLNIARGYIPLIESLDYQYQPEVEEVFSDRIYFWKGKEEVHTAHLALIEKNSPHWPNVIAFRDYLRKHPQDAKNYEVLKRESAEKYPYDPIAYANGKEEFIISIDEKKK